MRGGGGVVLYSGELIRTSCLTQNLSKGPFHSVLSSANRAQGLEPCTSEDEMARRQQVGLGLKES